MYGGIGYAVVDNDNEPNYNLNANSVDFLLNYRIGKRYGISTGIGINQLSGNGFSSLGNFYHERGLLKIPLLLSVDYNLSQKVRLVANIGLYGQTILKDEYSFVGGKIDDLYEGWNFGFQSGIGLAYNFNQKISLGIMFHNQGDFTKLDSDTSKGIADEQKIAGLNSIGLLFAINL
jgi:opacity protein-like surface antigen